jgi:hypothetical protein
MTLTFACGHQVERAAEQDAAPRCAICQEHRVTRVDAPAPRFRGLCSGPVAVKG